MRVKTLVSILYRQVEDRYSPLATELGVPSVALEILEALYAEDGQQPTVLAHHVGRAATSLTPILDQMVKRGFIIRQAHPTDRRMVQIFLTDRGHKTKATLNKFMEEVEASLRKELLDRLQDQPDVADPLNWLFAPLPVHK